MEIDLKAMNRKELEQLKAQVEKAIKKAEKQELKKAREAAERAAMEHGFSLAELTGPAVAKGAAKASKSPAKYHNPANPSQTWSGRGRQPQWFKDAIQAGKSPEDLEI